jgi:hypothetical protein
LQKEKGARYRKSGKLAYNLLSNNSNFSNTFKIMKPHFTTGGNMKTRTKNQILTLLFLAAFLATANLGFAATLVWEPPSEGTVTGYNVRYGQSSTAPTTSVNAGNVTQYSLDNAPLAEKTTYYFWVTAYNANAESSPAGPVSYATPDNTPPIPPLGLAVQ